MLEFVEEASEIITNYYYWQKWKSVKNSKTQVAYEWFVSFLLIFEISNTLKNNLYILLKFIEIFFKIYVAYE